MNNSVAEIFAAGFDRFKNYIRSVFSQINEYDAEDIVQQTALSMLDREDEDVEYLTSYIYAALRNGAKNFFRKRGREVLTDEQEGEYISSAEEELLETELKEKIARALSLLDDKSRFVFEQTEFFGKSYKELSQETGEPLGTLLSRKSRAMKKLSIILEEYKNI